MPADKIEEYQAAVVACAAARAVLRQHDLPGLLEAIDHAESFGPILDPTLYREKSAAMEQDRELLRAALALRNFEPKEPTR